MFDLLFISRRHPINTLALVLIILWPSTLMAMTTYRTIHISSTPSGALITNQRHSCGKHATDTPGFSF
jgi:hypothetical protein